MKNIKNKSDRKGPLTFLSEKESSGRLSNLPAEEMAILLKPPFAMAMVAQVSVQISIGFHF